MTEVVVIGGGVMGSSTAWQLARRGVGVTLLEQFQPLHDKGASHGDARIFRLAYPDQTHVRLAQRALVQWRELEEETGLAVLTLTGHVDHGPKDTMEALYGSLRTAGAAAELLPPAVAAERWPGLRFDEQVLFHPEGGRLHADDAVRAFQQGAINSGADVRHGVRVAEIAKSAAAVVVTTTSGKVFRGDAVVVSAGAWTSLLQGQLSGLLRTTQEQPSYFPVRDPSAPWPSFIHHPSAGFDVEGGVYGLGSVDGVKVGFHGIGPVVDPDHRDRTPDPTRLKQLADYAEQWLPGVHASRGVPVTCLYTTTPDQRFIVDRVGQTTVLAGFSGHGFKFASAIGELATGLVLDGTEPVPELAVARFAAG